ncbi:uncharacterized protein BDZ99DRAFT_514077 [Mytilinidion resinicola]|uniref:Uncharacterized protein n=1 Tax=Mytilinidion resinicola TaxID=574789 RepID=A0A6A6Z9Q7_9PEZI|nr:uncharacterized protein BDZ99DRAFT_514077 [Mytilinidion resinicola]KAF2817862.1 hypothetical protein BDZ99DRAFT_514077 [Mytilinidion resinicola]
MTEDLAKRLPPDVEENIVHIQHLNKLLAKADSHDPHPSKHFARSHPSFAPTPQLNVLLSAIKKSLDLLEDAFREPGAKRVRRNTTKESDETEKKTFIVKLRAASLAVTGEIGDILRESGAERARRSTTKEGDETEKKSLMVKLRAASLPVADRTGDSSPMAKLKSSGLCAAKQGESSSSAEPEFGEDDDDCRDPMITIFCPPRYRSGKIAIIGSGPFITSMFVGQEGQPSLESLRGIITQPQFDLATWLSLRVTAVDLYGYANEDRMFNLPEKFAIQLKHTDHEAYPQSPVLLLYSLAPHGTLFIHHGA